MKEENVSKSQSDNINNSTSSTQNDLDTNHITLESSINTNNNTTSQQNEAKLNKYIKTQKRQFEIIKNEINEELSSESSGSGGLTSAAAITSSLNTESDDYNNEQKHLLESESKRQKSDLINQESDELEFNNNNNNNADNIQMQTSEQIGTLIDSNKKIASSPPDTESQTIINDTNSISSSLSLSSENMESEATTSKMSLNESPKKTKIKFDPNECHDWDRIHDTDFYKERSFNFNDIMNRELGFGGRFGHGNRNNFGLNFSCKKKSLLNNQQIQSPRQMINKAVSGFNFVRRMKMTQNLNYHEGCVNALNFNRIGTLLASGSDDYQVCIWDWARSKVLLTFDSGHKSNVFQTKFMPFTRDSQIVTCARDGQVRLALISSSGSHLGTKKLAKHADSCHKLSIEYDSSNMFLSCGEDGVVYEIDLRQPTPAKILTVKNLNRNCKLPLYSISSNPLDTYQFCVAGKDPYVRIYDKRMLVDDRSKILKQFSPLNLKDSQRANITSAVYSNNGTEIVASYSDDDIYLFETSQDTDKDAKYRYRGHRNSETIKGVNFYGANNDFIISGSDCGRVFFWEKSTQQIVQALKGDESGVVNVLEPHPNFPILATSGLDSDIKIWSPTSETSNPLDNLADIIKDNQRARDTSRHFSLSSFEFELLLLLMHRPNNRVLIRTNDEELLRNRLIGRENNENNASNITERFTIRHRNRVETDETNEEEDENEDDDDDDEDDDEYEEDEDDEEDEEDTAYVDEETENASRLSFFEDSSDNFVSEFFNRRNNLNDLNEDTNDSNTNNRNL